MVRIVTGALPVLTTRTVKVKWPPGSGRLVGLADFSTRMVDPAPWIETVAVSVSVTVLLSPSVSTAVAVTVSVSVSSGDAGEVADEAAAVVAAGADRGGHVTRALAVQVAVDVVGEAGQADRSAPVLLTVDGEGEVASGSREGCPGLRSCRPGWPAGRRPPRRWSRWQCRCAVTVLLSPSRSTAVAVTVSVRVAPATPVNGPVKEQS